MLCLTLLVARGHAVAQPVPAYSAALREQVVMVPKDDGTPKIELETTLYRPPGQGPFPVVVINHGKSPGNPRSQTRSRFEAAARMFIERGYMVAIPMRQGFSQSTGTYFGGGCDIEGNGRRQAADVLAVLAYLRRLPDADTSRVVVVGQSHGGLTTMALGGSSPPGVRGLINFAGGLRVTPCATWQNALVEAFAAYGRESHLPSIWFYGDNDRYWSPSLYRKMYAAYEEGGGHAQLVAYGTFGTNSHDLFSSTGGLPIWVPDVERFLAGLGLPAMPTIHLPPVSHDGPVPPPTGAFPLEDAAAVPHAGTTARAGYSKFLTLPWPRAFALAPSGAWALRSGTSDAMRAALAQCNEHAKTGTCRLYAVDGHIVWTPE